MTKLVVIIVGFRCSDDIINCLDYIRAMSGPAMEIHICENGGEASYRTLQQDVATIGTPRASAPLPHVPSIVEHQIVDLHDGRYSVVLHRAGGNLGYAGGVNAVLAFVEKDPDWSAVWILNPDTEPDVDAAVALQQRAASGPYGIVGSRLVLKSTGRIQLYGGRWRTWMARGFNIGLGEPATAVPDIEAVERQMDYVVGASMYVTRDFIDAVGPMDERYFLYAEEVDWCLRRGEFRLGYAHDSIIHHVHGATIGSHSDKSRRSTFSVYLDERSKILLTRRFWPQMFPLIAVSTLVFTTQYLRAGAFRNYRAALSGWAAGIRGETGFPKQFLPRTAG